MWKSKTFTFWFNGDNNSISISFSPKLFSKGIFTTNNGAKKHIDLHYSKTLYIFGLCLNYSDWNYNNVMYLNIYANKGYSHIKERDNISVLKAALNLWSVHGDTADLFKTLKGDNLDDYTYLLANKAPFKFTYSLEDEGIVYHLIVKKEWLIKHNFKTLVEWNFLEAERLKKDAVYFK